MEHRLKLGLVVFLLCIIILAGRLCYIQIACHDELSDGAERQQLIPVLYQYSRGVIFDRNMNRMTDTSVNYYYLIHNDNLTNDFLKLISLVQGERVGQKGEDYLVYCVKEFSPSIHRQLREVHHVYSFCVSERYDDQQIAAHLIGGLNKIDGTGISGLEMMYEEQLSCEKPAYYLYGNGLGDPMYGEGIKVGDETADSPSALITTIDCRIQTEAERIMAEKDYSGALIVMDTKTGQILSMTSSPGYNPNHIEDYLSSSSGELLNKAVQGLYPPGSVFKIIVAAAALEEDSSYLTKTYSCKGKVNINGIQLCCAEEKKHGTVSLSDAFAQSCNCYFAQLAKDLGSESIIRMAEKIGLGKTVLERFPGEETGILPAYEERVYSGLSNLSIGQGSLLVTPLQICQMTNVIANGGVYFSPSLVMSEKNSKDQKRRVMNADTAEKISSMMCQVIENGTAAGTKLDVRTAGKTGSAEASYQGKSVVHGWFTGYFPAEDPIYTITVFVENGKTGSQSALPVFEQISSFLLHEIGF